LFCEVVCPARGADPLCLPNLHRHRGLSLQPRVRSPGSFIKKHKWTRQVGTALRRRAGAPGARFYFPFHQKFTVF